MSKLAIDDGLTLQYVVSGSDVAAGDMSLVGDTVGIEEIDAAVGETAVLNVHGTFGPIAAETSAMAVGERLYFDGSELTLVATSNNFAGVAANVSGAGNLFVNVKLMPGALAGGS